MARAVTPEAANIVGFIGTGLIVLAYFYLTASKTANPLLLHGLNLTGAMLLVASLLVNRNLPSLVLESIWAAVAIVGLCKALLSPSRTREGLGVGQSDAGSGPPPAPSASGRGEP
jgi:hypothetical protein